MNTIELMLEAAKDALSGWKYIREVHGDLYGVGWDRVEMKLTKAIAAGKAELRREPDAWIYAPSGEPVEGIPEEFLCPTAHMAEPTPEGNDKVIPVWQREEIK